LQAETEKVKVVLYIGEWRVEGDLHVLMKSRLTDALNARQRDFLAVTDATIYHAVTGEKIVERPFLDVNREAITVIYTVD